VHTHQSNLIVIGSYGFNPLVEIMLGSSVDQVLRESSVPVLLCR
jgi:nucleotide-binding universal stress UspA family protein